MVDLFGLAMLLFGYLSSGPADDWSWHAGLGLRYSYGAGESAITLTFSADPTPIRYRRPPEWMGWKEGRYCGLTDGYNVWVAPHSPCIPGETILHELNHVQQRRAVGLFGMAVMGALNMLEPSDGYTPSLMHVPRGDGFSLFRLEIPLIWR